MFLKNIVSGMKFQFNLSMGLISKHVVKLFWCLQSANWTTSKLKLKIIHLTIGSLNENFFSVILELLLCRYPFRVSWYLVYFADKRADRSTQQAWANLVSKYAFFDNANLEKLSSQQNFNAWLHIYFSTYNSFSMHLI